MSVLITCALGVEAHRLKKQLHDTVIILGDFAEVPDFMVKSGQIIKLPLPAGAAYQHEMLTLCLDNDVNVIYPVSETERKALLESNQLFAEYGITIKDIPDGI